MSQLAFFGAVIIAACIGWILLNIIIGVCQGVIGAIRDYRYLKREFRADD